ncbi:MAG TPA: DUF4105 domain-containing protein [Thermoanaerobaculia bacterium]
MRGSLKLMLAAPPLAVAAAVLLTAMKTPSLDRRWDEDVRVLAGVELAADGSVRLTDVRDWRYERSRIVEQRYFDATYDPADIVDVWMYEQILDGERGLIAHTFVVFEFDSTYGAERYLGLSVETRREAGETYSLIGGVLRRFEVTHIWATERDLVTRRVQYLDYPLTRYRLVLTPEQRARVFTRFAEETRELGSHPAWYNTVTRNCTSSLIRYVNEGRPGALPRHWSWVLTGRVDDYLDELGYLDRGPAQPITRAYLAGHDLR